MSWQKSMPASTVLPLLLSPYSDTEMRPVTGAYLYKYNMELVKQLMAPFGIIPSTKHHMPAEENTPFLNI